MVDSRPQATETELTRLGEGGPFVSLIKARFVLAAVVIAAALGLGFGGSGVEESRRVAVAQVPELRLDPNTVPPEVLTALPHVGSALVDRWVKAREERPFRSLEDARARVRGLGAATLAQIAPYFEDPEGQRLSAKPLVSQKNSRPSAKLRTALRKKPGSTKASATKQPRLAARAPH